MIPSSEIIDIFNTEASAFRWEILHENPEQVFVVSKSYDNPIVIAVGNKPRDCVLETIQSWYPHRKIFRLEYSDTLPKDLKHKYLGLYVRMLTPAHLLHADEVSSRIWSEGRKAEMLISVVAQGSQLEYRLFNDTGYYRWKSTRKWCTVGCALWFNYSLEDFHNTGVVVPRFTSCILHITNPPDVWIFLAQLAGRRFITTVGFTREPVVYYHFGTNDGRKSCLGRYRKRKLK